MAIEGNIETFPLVDVLTLLTNSGKTGILYIQGKKGTEEIKGEVHIVKGKIYDAFCGKLTGEEAFNVLFLIDEGSFSFKLKELDTKQNITKSIDALMIDAIRIADETKDLYKKIPPRHTIIEMNPNPPENNIELSPDEWHVMYLFMNPTSIEDALKNTILPETKVVKTLYALLSVGLLKKSENLVNIPQYIFDKIEDYIQKNIGTRGIYYLNLYLSKGVYDLKVFKENIIKFKNDLSTISDERKIEETIKFILKSLTLDLSI
ncbi:MAG: DUF4388 domain-containing protein [Caldisericia bacterium]|nr:DUF4388 domain-containing protein [Caldisericia bacterium]